jgi:hypothetical protein
MASPVPPAASSDRPAARSPGPATHAQESRAGAWWGLFLVLYGCASLTFAGLVAAQQYVSDGVLERVLLQVQAQRVEGGIGPGMSELGDELMEVASRLAAPVYQDAAATGGLALFMLFCGIGIAWRRPAALRAARVAIVAKLVTTLLALYVVHASFLPNLKLTLAKAEEFVEMAQVQSGRGSLQLPAGLGDLVDPCAIALATGSVALLLLSLRAVFGNATRTWCGASADSTVATPGARR